MSLVLPSLYSELSTDALANIVNELCDVPYLDEIVIGLDRANKEEYQHALQYFKKQLVKLGHGRFHKTVMGGQNILHNLYQGGFSPKPGTHFLPSPFFVAQITAVKYRRRLNRI